MTYPKLNISKLPIKKIDLLLVKSFIGPFILTFFIALFVLVMQFLWKYVDDLVGKGLDTWVLAELMFYSSARLVPLALPLAVLLSSIMTFGALGEHMELTAAKSAGISLLRLMQPLIITVAVISIGAFFFSNNLLPISNLKFTSLLYDIRNQKPTVAIKEGIFYNEIDGFNLRVDKKSEDGNLLYGIILYDHTSGMGSDHVIYAKKGKLIQDEENSALTLLLENGKQYKDVSTRKKPEDPENYDLYYTKFKSWEKKFDLSKFKLSRSDENFFKDLKQMLGLSQLLLQMDTLKTAKENLQNSMLEYSNPYFSFSKFNKDSINAEQVNSSTALFVPFKNIDDYLSKLDRNEQNAVFERAKNQSRNIKNYAEILQGQIDYKYREYVSYLIEVYRKFTLSIACLVLFFIGAPLGSIIRKGGLGWPLAYSIVFFIVYHVTSIIGEKSAEKLAMSTFSGMWLSTFVLLPIGIFLSYKAMKDSALFNKEPYIKLWNKVAFIFYKKAKA
jgi:lipopolysaccharide export system permease protein